MKKETYDEAKNLQQQINELKSENEILEDVSEQLAEMEKTPEEDKPKELPVRIEGVDLRPMATVHLVRSVLLFTPKAKELKDTVDKRIASNQNKITKLTNKFDAL